MIHDFSPAYVEDMRDMTRALWTSSCDWDDLLGLLSDPAEFFRSQGIEIRFGDPCSNIVLAFTAAPDAQAYDLVVEGMDDTNVLSVSAKWQTVGQPGMTDTIAIDMAMPVVIQIRGGDRTSTVHLHLADSVNRRANGVAYQNYLMIRWPELLTAALTTKIGEMAHHGAPYITFVDGMKSDVPALVNFTAASMRTALVEYGRESKMTKICDTARCPVTVNGAMDFTLSISHIMGRVYR